MHKPKTNIFNYEFEYDYSKIKPTNVEVKEKCCKKYKKKDKDFCKKCPKLIR